MGNGQLPISDVRFPISDFRSPISDFRLLYPLRRAKVTLFTNGVRLARPRRELAVEILNRIEPEGVKVISRGERLDAQEPGVLDPTREHEVTDEIPPPNTHRGE
jgi:hypothetical protein